jgi:uncharacterized protein YebE (UPF0316 family)
VTLSLILGSLVIFFLRILDVSVGTLRIGMVVRGRRRLAGLFSFVESLIWLIAAAQVLGNLNSPLKFVAYAGGYAAGTMLGSTIERWLAMGSSLIRIIAPVASPSVDEQLREKGFYLTVMNAEGRDGEVSIGFSVVPRKRVQEVLSIIREVNPEAFVTVEETTPVRLSALPAASVRK